MIGLLAKVLGRADRIAIAMLFRARHRLRRGTLKIDRRSVANVSWGRGVALRGTVVVNNASVEIGDACRIGKDAEAGCVNKGVVIIGNVVSLRPRIIILTTVAAINIRSSAYSASDCLV